MRGWTATMRPAQATFSMPVIALAISLFSIMFLCNLQFLVRPDPDAELLLLKEAGSGLCDDKGHFATALACRPDGDLNVLAQGHEKVHQPFNREGPRLAAHEARDVRLLNTQNFTGLGLGEAAFFDEAINLQGEAGFELPPLGIGKAEIGKNIAAAFFDPDLGVPFHFSCAVLCNPAQRPQAAGLSSRLPFWLSICPSLISSGK